MSALSTTLLLVQALRLLVELPILLWRLPLDRVLAALTPLAPIGQSHKVSLKAIEHVTDLLTRRFPPTRTACLKRALLRYAMLRRAGYAACFMIGVRPGGEEGFEAHAWVTLDDAPIMEREPLSYRAAFVWPSAKGSPSEAHTQHQALAAVFKRRS